MSTHQRDVAIVEAATSEHVTQAELARRFGLTRGRVGQILRKHGLSNPGRGERHHRWRGGRSLSDDGYINVIERGHPRAHKTNGYVREHILIVERALGRPLPPKAVVHHVNEVRTDNRNRNLVACEDDAYHALVHQRTRAYRACGHADWRKCRFCKVWEPPEGLVVLSGKCAYHQECNTRYGRERKARLRQAEHEGAARA